MTYDTINDAQTIAGNGEGTLLAGRYRIVRQLGQGGMGSVWLAEDIQLDNKPFAIKMLPSILVSNKRAYRQLKDEALVAMRLVHPNIVQIRAFEENNGNPFLVMDYVDGQTLDDYLAEHRGGDLTQSRREAEAQSGRARSPSGPQGNNSGRVEHVEDVERVDSDGRGISESDVLRILKPIAAALDYAHGEGVVHRDVKPANVMIRKDGHPYILDFGIAREIQETMTRVTGKLSSGTLLYMSPEQLHGAAPKKEQDIYSFAAMAYECLSGNPPFCRGQIEYQIDNDTPEPLSGRDGSISLLAASVMAGLAKKPDGRPPTCSAILECHVHPPLHDAAGSSYGTESSPSGTRQTERKQASSNKVIPEEDVRYLPPDMRESLNGVTTTSDGKREQCRTSYDRPVVRDNPFVRNEPAKRNDVGIGAWTWIGIVATILISCFGIVYKVRWQNSADTSYYSNSREASDKELAERCKAEAENAMSNARRNKAEELCPEEWTEAEDGLLIATAEFARREYDKARNTFAKSASLFWKCANQAKNIAPKHGFVERAQRQVAEKEQLKIAERPKIYLTATLDGVRKPALITGGLQENNKYKTPLNVDVVTPLGSKGEFAVEYFENGIKYVGKGGYTVQKGLQNVNVVLSRPRPATMNFCPYCTRSLEKFDKIGVKCPFCGKNLPGN